MDAEDQLSERVERAALVSLHDHCPAETREELGLFGELVGDAFVAGAKHDPSFLINRTLGLGTEQPVTREAVAAVADDQHFADGKLVFDNGLELLHHLGGKRFCVSDRVIKGRYD